MNNFTFRPWVGPLYNEGGLHGLKILVLGESHYVKSGEQHPKFTQDVVKTHAINGRKSFFTKTAKALVLQGASYGMSQDEKRHIWESIAFYNYVQTPMSGPRIRPEKHMWTEAKPYFEHVP